MQITSCLLRIWDKIMNLPNILTNILTTREGWKDLLIPMLGSIVIPILILVLTWLFGYKWQEMQNSNKENIEKLSYLRSLMYYLVNVFLALRKLVKANYDLVSMRPTFLQIDEEINFLPSEDIYSQFEPSKYVNFLKDCPPLITHLLDIKAFVTDIFESIDKCNSIIEHDKNLSFGKVNPILKNSLEDLLFKIKGCIDSALEVLRDIEQIEQQTKIPLVQLSFSKEIQEQLECLFPSKNKSKTESNQF